MFTFFEKLFVGDFQQNSARMQQNSAEFWEFWQILESIIKITTKNIFSKNVNIFGYVKCMFIDIF